MNEITRIAVKRTMDPMQELMNCLFEKKADVFISNKILELIKKTHSYTMLPCGSTNIYTFHKRIRGTDVVFSFMVAVEPTGNRVFGLDCIIAELGLIEKYKEAMKVKNNQNVYLMMQED